MKCVTGSDCTDDVCVAKAKAGDSCKSGDTISSEFCPIGTFCDTTETEPTCKTMLDDKAECSLTGASDQCGLGSICVQTGDNPACAAYNSIAVGTELKGWTHGTASQNNLVCKGGNVFENKVDDTVTYHCMTPSKNQNTDITKGIAAGDECKIDQFVDPTNAETKSDGTKNALCGFNKGTLAFCPAQIGDSNVAEAITNAITVWTANRLTCPAKGNTAYCAKFDDANRKTLTAFTKHWAIGTNLQGWPNVADNADCVQGTYSSWFYGINSAASLSVAAAFAALSVAL